MDVYVGDATAVLRGPDAAGAWPRAVPAQRRIAARPKVAASRIRSTITTSIESAGGSNRGPEPRQADPLMLPHSLPELRCRGVRRRRLAREPHASPSTSHRSISTMLGMSLRDQVLAAVEAASEDMIAFASDLIRIPTINPPGDEYVTCAERI